MFIMKGILITLVFAIAAGARNCGTECTAVPDLALGAEETGAAVSSLTLGAGAYKCEAECAAVSDPLSISGNDACGDDWFLRKDGDGAKLRKCMQCLARNDPAKLLGEFLYCSLN
jgi:hypothetical protein